MDNSFYKIGKQSEKIVQLSLQIMSFCFFNMIKVDLIEKNQTHFLKKIKLIFL